MALPTETQGGWGWIRRTAEVLDGAFDTVTNAIGFNNNSLSAGEDLVNNTLGITSKPAASPAYSWVMARGFTAGTYLTAKPTGGALHRFVVTNANAAMRYLLVVNTGSAPSGSTGVVASFPIPAGTATNPGNTIVDMSNYYLSSGVTLAVSTADGTYTAATAADHTLHAWSF